MASVAKLLQNLAPDPWREKHGFSQDIEFANRQILDKSKSDEEISISLCDWLEDKQYTVRIDSCANWDALRSSCC